jgi:hypothetical protein
MRATQLPTMAYDRARSASPITLFVFLVFLGMSKYSAAQSLELASPNGRYTFRIEERSLPHADPYLGDCTLILSDRKQVLSRVPTTGYLINALWSADDRYVAVNNRRGNSGDYVWVFSLIDGRALKVPDDKSFPFPLRKIRKICSDCNEGSFDRDLIIAKAWKSTNELEVETRWRFYKTALIVRYGVYKISGRKMVPVHEQISSHPVDWQPPEP